MHIGSQFVGTPFKTYQSQITWRDTMNYAAAINDGNPLFFDVINQEGDTAISHGYALLVDKDSG